MVSGGHLSQRVPASADVTVAAGASAGLAIAAASELGEAVIVGRAVAVVLVDGDLAGVG